MLVSILNFIFNVIHFVITVVSWLVLIYVVMTLIVPQNKYTQMIGKYVEPVLAPLRAFLYRVFPKLREIGMDFSPLLFYLAIQVLSWLLSLLQRILL